MACVNSFNFVIIINGYLTSFYKAHRGLRQGFKLSPILFLLIMKALSWRIGGYCAKDLIVGIKLTRNINISHVMFLDNLLFRGQVSLLEWKHFHHLLNSFGFASGRIMNSGKPKLIVDLDEVGVIV